MSPLACMCGIVLQNKWYSFGKQSLLEIWLDIKFSTRPPGYAVFGRIFGGRESGQFGVQSIPTTVLMFSVCSGRPSLCRMRASVRKLHIFIMMHNPSWYRYPPYPNLSQET